VADISQRDGWNRPAAREFALPTETWREHVARRQRCQELRDKLLAGEVHQINDLITYNLDLRQFAEDVISNCEGPELLRAFYQAISTVTVLDPTCGSGAFLFAALNILEPLYEACLDRMQAFVDDLERSGERHHPGRFADFRRILSGVEKHPNRRYFILKSIIVNNLYGVDIMEEAVEICKLRLFLKLVAQVDRVKDLEPLPDIDFNIRPGNTLVGFVSVDEIRRAAEWTPSGERQMVYGDTEKAIQRIEEEAKTVEGKFRMFHDMQTDYGMDARDFATAKQELRGQLKQLADELDRYLAGEYGIDLSETDVYSQWCRSHQPFHWFAEFYGIMKRGGFDVIIGNPPYVEYKDVRSTYQIVGSSMEECGNLFAYVLERCAVCGHEGARAGMIIPLSAFSTDRMIPFISYVKRASSIIHIANFSWRPGKLFDGVNLQLSILLQRLGAVAPRVFSTQYLLWDSEARPELFSKIQYAAVIDEKLPGSIPKLGCKEAVSILHKLQSRKEEIGRCFERRGQTRVFYRRGGLYWKVFVDFETGSSEEKIIGLQPKIDKYTIIAALSSDLWFWYFTSTSDCRHLGNRDIDTFPFDPRSMHPDLHEMLASLGREYDVRDLKRNAQNAVRVYKGKKAVDCLSFRVKLSKPIIDEIDRALAKHYGFTDEELNFIINYDIKYRMGQEDGEQEA